MIIMFSSLSVKALQQAVAYRWAIGMTDKKVYEKHTTKKDLSSDSVSDISQ